VTRTDRVDRFQRRHAWIGFPLAVAYKAFDDRAPYLAGLITYYAFVSVFPLLLLFLAAAGFFLDGAPGLRQDLVNSALSEFPGIADKLRSNINGFHGSGAALAVGIIGTMYGGLGVMQAAQAAFNQIYGVPRNQQPNPFKSRLRSLGLIALIGTGVLITTVISITVSTTGALSQHFGGVAVAGGYLLSLLLNVGLFTAAFQLLTARDLHIRNVITGGVVAGSLWFLLQIFGSRFVSREAEHAGSVYGYFGLVLAVVAWLYLQSLILVMAAEINVVLHGRLWPRALLTPFTDDVELTKADQKAYAMYARAQRFKGFQRITTDFCGDFPDECPPNEVFPDEPTPADRRVTGVEEEAVDAGEPARTT
jgi:YihY family inner membrane protein